MTTATTIRALVAVAIGCGVVGAGPAGAGAASSASSATAITLHNIRFHPGVVHIAAGASVTWRWDDAGIDTEHNVTSIGRHRFKSSGSKQAGTYKITFSRAGVYRFECTIHPQSMHGEIVVG